MSFFKKNIFEYAFDINNNMFKNIWGEMNFDGKIQKKSFWWGIDNLKNYLLRGNKEYSKTDILYEINEYGFRTSKETNNIDNTNVLACFGCSNTFGQALPWDETWPSVLFNLLNKKFNVKNYGVCGASMDSISRLISNYLEYNKPKIICCFFPCILRVETFIDDNFNNVTPHLDNNIKQIYNDIKLIEALKVTTSIENGLNNFIKNFKFIHNLCKLHDVKFYWYTWSIPILSLNLNTISEILDYDSYLGKEIKDITIFNIMNHARDGLHFNKDIMKIIANGFYEKIKNEKTLT